MRYAPNSRRALSTRERRPALKKINTVAKRSNGIFRKSKLTIGLDLGGRTSNYCILDETGNVILEHSVATTPKGIHQVFSKIAQSRIALENRDPFPMGKPAVDPLGPRSDRGSRTQRASDRREQPKRRSTGCPDAGTASKNRSWIVGSSAISQCQSANPSDGEPRPSGARQYPHGAGECRMGADEILWRAAEEVRHRATELRDRQGTGTAASRAWRKECQEASRRCGGPEVGRTPSQVVGKRRGL
jgi:hypothetical protein